ncbi:MAG: hypothetical protein HYV95_00100 [Opitutae bacterium]|nr:hypothetical protein [Opitutae bacterium]
MHTRTFITLVLVLAIVTVMLAEPPQRTLLREAAAAQQAGDNVTALAKLKRAAKFAPDYPRIHLELARLHARQNDPAAAFASLRVLADMGLAFGELDHDPAFAALHNEAAFAALRDAFAANARPLGLAGETRRSVAGVTGILESVATHPHTGETFFGDVRNRCIWQRTDDGSLKKFSADDDGLLGVFALKFSADGRTLWASSSAVTAMNGYRDSDKSRGFVAEYDLASRKLRRLHPLPADDREHVLGDFAVAADGTLYVTDSTAPVIWRLPPGADALESWISYPWFISLQGAAVSSDGRLLFVADYANGIWRIDPVTRQATALRAPAGSTLFGIDGLYMAPGALLAIQNGITPQRVLRIALTPAGEASAVTVLAQDPQTMPDLSLGQLAGERFEFIGDSGWVLFDDPAAQPAAHTITLHSIPFTSTHP